MWNQGVAWTRDGRSIVYADFGHLWRVLADGGAPPHRLELAGPGSNTPSAARGRDRLVFNRLTYEADIYGLRLGGVPIPLVQSTFQEILPSTRRTAARSPSSAGVRVPGARSVSRMPTARIPRG